jgi:hypothetical protein
MPRAGIRLPGDTDRHYLTTERRVLPPRNVEWQNAVTAEPETWCDCADISISVPAAWAGVVSYRVLTRHGSVIHQAGTGLIPVTALNLGGRLNGTILRIRGVRFDSVAVEIRAPLQDGAPFTAGTMRVECWARSSYPWHELQADGRLMIEGEPSVIKHSAVAVPLMVPVWPLPIRLRKVHWYNPNASALFLLLWNRQIPGAAGAAPDLVPIPIGATSGGSIDYPSSQLTALSWTTSTTASTYTVPNPDLPIWVDVHYYEG